MPVFGLLIVVWLSDVDRERLTEIAGRADAPTERLGARLLSKALLLYTGGETIERQEPRASVTREGMPGRRYCAPRSSKG
ncbi:hypothetical protein F6X37_29230 [Paraburkholderia sp. 31.1]|uniref:hypothetical protein n=1 Tax=Paraburkholderia sp. 31.1 TaxID=2615205 RepID=UPI001654D810|nr:hypothetical protein [Paraburkholderia sp. 31.1]MBC8725506.1 hypothetical protein [Paraburkholderia sp. 31.1]